MLLHTASRTLALLTIAEIRRRRRRKKHSGAAATAIVPSGPTTYASDSFNRADGGIGTADTGQVWTNGAGTWSVASNLAKFAAGAGVRNCYLDDGQTDGVFTLTMVGGTSSGVMIRWVDATNLIFTRVSGGLIRLIRVTAGVSTTIGSGGAAAAGDTVQLQVSGDNIDLYINGVLQFSATEAQGDTSTKHGLAGQTATDTTDDWSHASA